MDNRYTEYNLREFQYCFPVSFSYMKSKNQPTIKWSYGDTVKLNFDLTDYDTDDWDFSTTTYINIIFKNFREEIIKVVEQEVTKTSRVVVSIGKDDSTNTFKNGMYYIDVELLNDTDVMTLQKNIEVVVG